MWLFTERLSLSPRSSSATLVEWLYWPEVFGMLSVAGVWRAQSDHQFHPNVQPEQFKLILATNGRISLVVIARFYSILVFCWLDYCVFQQIISPSVNTQIDKLVHQISLSPLLAYRSGGWSVHRPITDIRSCSLSLSLWKFQTRFGSIGPINDDILPERKGNEFWAMQFIGCNSLDAIRCMQSLDELCAQHFGSNLIVMLCWVRDPSVSVKLKVRW